MLKITTVPDAGADETIQLEGKLSGLWVAELLRFCSEVPNQSSNRRFDLSAVSFIDSEGVRALRGLMKRGFLVTRCSNLVAEMLKAEAP